MLTKLHEWLRQLWTDAAVLQHSITLYHRHVEALRVHNIPYTRSNLHYYGGGFFRLHLSEYDLKELHGAVGNTVKSMVADHARIKTPVLPGTIVHLTEILFQTRELIGERDGEDAGNASVALPEGINYDPTREPRGLVAGGSQGADSDPR